MNRQMLSPETFEGYRAAVPGGWLGLVAAHRSEEPLLGGRFGGLTFLPDAGHAWDGSHPLASPLELRGAE